MPATPAIEKIDHRVFFICFVIIPGQINAVILILIEGMTEMLQVFIRMLITEVASAKEKQDDGQKGISEPVHFIIV
jgi:hypothetical protein